MRRRLKALIAFAALATTMVTAQAKEAGYRHYRLGKLTMPTPDPVSGGLLLILHVYLGTVAYPGTARGMIDGKVTTAWARLHHPRWSGERVEH